MAISPDALLAITPEEHTQLGALENTLDRKLSTYKLSTPQDTISLSLPITPTPRACVLNELLRRYTRVGWHLQYLRVPGSDEVQFTFAVAPRTSDAREG